jgi:hypothetical protein
LNPLPPTTTDTLVRQGETVSIDLTLSIGALWAQTRLNHRRDITRAIRLGYVARMDDDWRHFESFKHLYRATMTRRSAAPFYFFGDAYFDRLRDALGESVHLCVVEKDGVVVAAELFVETNGIVSVPPLRYALRVPHVPADEADHGFRARLGERSTKPGPVPRRWRRGRPGLAAALQGSSGNMTALSRSAIHSLNRTENQAPIVSSGQLGRGCAFL